MKKYPVVIGRFEHLDIVDKIGAIPAKVDTGAYRSAIHASNIQLIKKGKNDSQDYLEFTLLGHPSFKQKRKLTTTKFSQVEVTSSNGHKAVRYEVNLKIRLGYKVFTSSFTLVDRTDTVFPVLIGRKVIRNRFLVDVTRSGLSRRELKVISKELINRGDEEYLEEVEQ